MNLTDAEWNMLNILASLVGLLSVFVWYAWSEWRLGDRVKHILARYRQWRRMRYYQDWLIAYGWRADMLIEEGYPRMELRAWVVSQAIQNTREWFNEPNWTPDLNNK